MADPDEMIALLQRLDLKEYEAKALLALLTLGHSTAPNIVDVTDIPNARVYDVLEELGEKGFIKIIPGRPKEYQVKPPRAILDRAIENRKQRFETYRMSVENIRGRFEETFEPLYQDASEDITPTEELFYVVDVGEASETETRSLYRATMDELSVLTKSFEYFEAVEPVVADVLDRGVTMRVLFLHPDHLSSTNRAIQSEIIAHVTTTYPEIDTRFSSKPLPWRGTLCDPSMDYDTGKAIFLVEEKDVPLHMRQAAITENGSFVAGMKRYFDLIWTYDSAANRSD